MEKIRIDDFIVHINTDNHRLEFEVYPVMDWTKPGTNESGTTYIDKENEPDTREIFEEGKCLKKLEGSYCWRGVWEGRLYFPDEEYWGEEIQELSDLYNNNIIPWCKEFIKKQDPNNQFEE